MSKLDEIQEMALSNRARQVREPAVALLIRAVRQLGAKLEVHLYSSMHDIDDDVVELLEES